MGNTATNVINNTPLPVHPHACGKHLERDPRLMADCLSSIGESLDINLIIGLHRIGHDARIGALLTDALYKELEAKV